MQFKNPEILYFLVLLIIPIIVHLFQLQKFVKVPFTNVAFLQKIIQDTRKSSRLKKWLILACRLLLFLAILFAFSQPYFSNKNVYKNQHIFIYLDNSLSTSANGKKGNLLKINAQEIIKFANEENIYSLQTNSDFYPNITKEELKNTLLKLKNTPKNIDFNTILVKIGSQQKNKTNTLYKNILISDFQYNYKNKFTNVTPEISLISTQPELKSNIAIDSVFISNTNAINFTVNVVIKNQGETKRNVPLALFNKEKLISKQSFSIDKDSEKKVEFVIQNQSNFSGKLAVTFSDTFSFDNTFYFSINTPKKIDVLAIGNNTDYLSKIYTKSEFNFFNTNLQNVNYNNIQKQQLIILHELEEIPEVLIKSISEFFISGGIIVIIPNKKTNIVSYNSFLKKINVGIIKKSINDTLKITKINYNHPFFSNVFSKKVTNFQYPYIQYNYPIFSKKENKILQLENEKSFLSKISSSKSSLYYFSAPISKKNSNFSNSPLIVPVFYNFAKLSFQNVNLYYRLQRNNSVDVETILKKDEILSIANKQNSFIPLQKTYQNKATLVTQEKPIEAGLYNILKNNNKIKELAYNNPKGESSLRFLEIKKLAEENKNVTISSSIEDVFNEINEKNEVHWLWKWFLLLAIVSLLLEILILKFYKT